MLNRFRRKPVAPDSPSDPIPSTMLSALTNACREASKAIDGMPSVTATLQGGRVYFDIDGERILGLDVAIVGTVDVSGLIADAHRSYSQ